MKFVMSVILGFFMPFGLLLLISDFIRNPVPFYALFAMLALWFFSMLAASRPDTDAQADRDALEAYRRLHKVDEDVLLVLSPEFDLSRSVVPQRRVGTHRRRPRAQPPVATGWSQAMGPALRGRG